MVFLMLLLLVCVLWIGWRIGDIESGLKRDLQYVSSQLEDVSGELSRLRTRLRQITGE